MLHKRLVCAHMCKGGVEEQMKDWETRRLLAKIARLYYEQKLTQSQIADKMGIYRTTISRHLKRARDEGIVTIQINDNSETYELERAIETQFNLKEVIVVPVDDSADESEKRALMGSAGAELLKRVIKKDDVVGLAWGSSIGHMAEATKQCQETKASFVPLVGGPGTMNTKHHVNTIVYKLAQEFNGTPSYIDAAAIVSKKETRDEIANSDYFKNIINLWENLTIAVVGIGNPIQSSNMVWSGFFGGKDIEELDRLNAVGDICSRFFDESGHMTQTELTDRTIAIELEELKRLNHSIGIAESIEKVPSILGALRGGYINILVTTDETAKALVARMSAD